MEPLATPRRSGRRWRLLLVLFALGAITAVGIPSAQAAARAGAPKTTLVAHGCRNPSTVSNGIRAGVCGDLVVENNRVRGQVEVFCQLATGDHHEVRCAGAEMGVDLWRRSPNGPWVQLEHSLNAACGGLYPANGACPVPRMAWWTASTYPVDGNQPCYYYYASGRASVQLPSGVVIRGIRVNSQEWAPVSCRV